MSPLSISIDAVPSKRIDVPSFDANAIQYDVQLAANIIKARMKLGMTQTQLAEKMNMVQPAIARAESGNRPPSHTLLKKIAEAMNARLIPADFVLQSELYVSGFSINSLGAEMYSNSTRKSVSSMRPKQSIPVSSISFATA